MRCSYTYGLLLFLKKKSGKKKSGEKKSGEKKNGEKKSGGRNIKRHTRKPSEKRRL